MPKYVTRPEVVEAFQFTGDNYDYFCDWVTELTNKPPMFEYDAAVKTVRRLGDGSLFRVDDGFRLYPGSYCVFWGFEEPNHDPVFVSVEQERFEMQYIQIEDIAKALCDVGIQEDCCE